MYIEPNTVIKLCKGVPLDKDFVNTLYFADKTAQTAYFNSKAKYSFSAQTFQRVDVGVARLQVDVGNVYDCNYMMFQNTSFSNKWFYAFIDRVEYHNNGLTNVYFTIDPLQTWFFDCTLQQCYVEREHSLTDGIGDNIIDEGLACGEYICTAEKSHFTASGGFYIVAITSREISSTLSHWVKRDPSEYGNVLSPYYIHLLDYSNLTDAEALDAIEKFSKMAVAPDIVFGGGDSSVSPIVGIYAIPKTYIDANSTFSDGFTTHIESIAQRTLSITPRNNKLYTYPYCLPVIEGDGQVVELNYDLFERDPDEDLQYIKLMWSFTSEGKILCFPTSYGGVLNDTSHSLEISCSIAQPVALNTFTLRLLRFALHSALTVASAAALSPTAVATSTTISSAATKTPPKTTTLFGGNNEQIKKIRVSGGTAKQTNESTTTHQTENAAEIATAHAVKSLIRELPQAVYANRTIYGEAPAADFLQRAGIRTLYSQCRCIRPEYAHIIDDYFTRYGYACKRTKVPNISSRPHWNYVQTVDCALSGDAPADAIEDIQAIFNNGITFWKNASEVGNYSLDNSPV